MASRGRLGLRLFGVVRGMRTGTFPTSLNAITLYDGRPAREAVKKPTLVVAGEFDPACCAAGMQLMQELVGRSELLIIPVVGHLWLCGEARYLRRDSAGLAVGDFLKLTG